MKKAAAETEEAWSGCGQGVGLKIWRIVQVSCYFFFNFVFCFLFKFPVLSPVLTISRSSFKNQRFFFAISTVFEFCSPLNYVFVYKSKTSSWNDHLLYVIGKQRPRYVQFIRKPNCIVVNLVLSIVVVSSH